MLKALEKAREYRLNPGLNPEPSVIYALAEEDAEDLLRRVQEELGGGRTVRRLDTRVGELVRNTSRKGLASGIFRHAMVEAGMIVPAAEGDKPYDPCPFCGWSPSA